MVADFYLYLLALLPNWWWLMGVSPLAIDRLLRSLSLSYAAWADGRWPLERRAKAFRLVAFAAIFVAGFMAFREEKAKLDMVNRNVEVSRHADYLPYDPIPQDKIDALSKALREHGKHPTAIIAADGDPSVVAVSEQIQDAFDDAGIQIQRTSGGRDSEREHGIQLYVHNPKQLNEDMQFYVRALGDLGIPVTLRPITRRGFEGIDFIVAVTPREITVR